MNQTEIAASLHEALGAHGVWKMRLRQAVQNGSSPTPIDEVRRDDCCALGRLLHEQLAPPQRAGADYSAVRDLHRQFHETAADALGLAVAGKAAEATQLIEGRFASLSTELGTAITHWRHKLV